MCVPCGVCHDCEAFSGVCVCVCVHVRMRACDSENMYHSCVYVHV